SSPGSNNIAEKVCRSSIALYVVYLTRILNLSLQEGVVSTELKKARVAPIFKAGDKHCINNYRPISVLPYFCKIFEKVVHKKLPVYL
ncbi:hypothetical protein CAPTEDRAFT_71803, partial [Capitella teleta]